MARKKYKRKPGWQAAQSAHDDWLRSMGINPNKKHKPKGVDMPDLSVQSTNTVPTSDKICGHGSIKEQNKYTGNEIAGIVVTHKST